MIADGADRLPAGGCSPCKGRGSPWQCNHHIKKVKLEEDGEGEDLVEREEEKGGDDIIIDKEADGVHEDEV